MISYFPKLHYDETWYSGICRYRDHTRQTTAQASFELFGKVLISLNQIVPDKLEKFLTGIGKYHSMTYDTIIENHTIVPLLSQFSSLQMNRIIRPRSFHGYCPFNSELIHPNYNLKYCHQCLEMDIAAHGECYWHRVHNIPGVKICVVHNCLLENWICSEQEFKIYNLLKSADSIVRKNISRKNNNDQLLRFSKIVTSLLYSSENKHINTEAMTLRAKEIDFLIAKKNRYTFESAMFRKFIEYLKEIDGSLFKSENQIRRIASGILVYRASSANNFLFQIALSEFIFNCGIPIRTDQTPTLYTCRNVFCDCYKKMLPKIVSKYKLSKGWGLKIKCSKCGMVYTCSPSTQAITIDYGSLFVSKVRELWSNGSSFRTISTLTGIHKRAIARVIKGRCREIRGLDITKRDLYRERLKAIMLSPNFMSIQASDLPNNIYCWIIKNDLKWYNELKAQTVIQKRKCKDIKSKGKKIDDDETLLRLKLRKEDLLKQNVTRLITKSLLLDLVDLQVWHLKYLPKCQAFLKSECDTSFSLRKRRLRSRLSNQTISFRVLKRAKLKEKLGYFNLNTNQREEFDLIFDEFGV